MPAISHANQFIPKDRTKCRQFRLARAALLLLLTLPAAAHAQFATDTANGAITIIGYTGSGGAVTIPSTINGLPVTCIGVAAFLDCTSVASVRIPASVSRIEDYAFKSCTGLIGVTIPNSVTSIGESAFEDCGSLTRVTIPNSTVTLGDWAFAGCGSLTSVTIPGSVTIIGRATFYSCTSLASVKIANGVTMIGDYAFYSCTSLEGVTIPNSVTSIGESAFGDCGSLTGVTIPNSTVTLGDWAFAGCGSLTSVTIPGSVTLIGDEAFYSCASLASVTISNGVTSLGEGVFEDCGSLTSVTIPNSVTNIGGGAFAACGSLASVTIPDSVTSLGGGAFFACGHLTSVTIGSSVNNIGSQAFYGCASLTSIIIPNSVRSLGDGAFASCTNLTSMTIPNSVTSIGEDAFRACENLTSMTIPNSVISLGYRAFDSCTGLTSVTIPGSVTMIGDEAFYSCTSLASVKISNGVTMIGDGAFYSCTSLEGVTIPNSVTSIGVDAFRSCDRMTSISVDAQNPVYSSLDGALFNKSQTTLIKCPPGKTGNYVIPNSVTGIENSAFLECTNLTGVSTGNSLTSIGDSEFRYCWSLTNVTIGESVASIGNYAFEGCGSLSSVIIPSSVISIGSYAFGDCTLLRGVYFQGNAPIVDSAEFVSFSSATLYYLEGTTGWDTGSGFGALSLALFDPLMPFTYNTTHDGQITIVSYIGPGGDVNIPGTINGLPVTNIESSAFNQRTDLTSVTIPTSVTSIGNWSFFYCTGLTSVNISPSVTSIGEGAFDGCAGLTSITIPTSLTSIGKSVFSFCTGLTSVTIPSSVTSIGETAFWNCTNLSSVIIPPSVTRIGDAAFSACSSLSSINIPLGVTIIGNGSFSSCTGLTSAIIPSSVTSIGDWAFEECTSLTSITLPPSVTSIGDFEFAYCTGLTSITLPPSVTSIGNSSFYACTNLTSVTIPASVTSIGDEAFEGCIGLISVTIPASVTRIGYFAFQACRSLTRVIFLGNAPFETLYFLYGSDRATVYYLSGATGWGRTYGGRPTVQLKATLPATSSVSAAACGDMAAGITGARFASFGIPAINDLGAVAFQAGVSGPAGSGVTTNDNSGIWVFSGSESTLIARTGSWSPALGFLDTLGDPVLNSQGEVAFLCTVKGPGFNSKNNQQIWANTLGTLHCVTQNWWTLDLLDTTGTGVKASSFPQIVLPDGPSRTGDPSQTGPAEAGSRNGGGVVFLANLVNGVGGATAATNQGIWAETDGGLKQLIRKGDILAGGTVSALSLFGSPSQVGVAGQTRSFNGNGDLSFKATFTNGKQGVFILTSPSLGSTPAAFSQVAISGSPAPAIFGVPAKFGVLGNPILNDNGNTAFQAFLSGTAKAAINYSAILAETGSSNSLGIVALTGSFAPDANGVTGETGNFASLSDPVFNSNDHIAFIGKLKTGGGVSGANSQGIWANTSGTLLLMARAQMQAPGCPAGAKFLSFVQLVLPDQGGVIFLANLTGASGGVNGTNNQGIWSVDTVGALHLVARKGDVLIINGTPKIISALSIFTASTGTAGQTRSFNRAGDLIYKVTFTDKTQAIQKVMLR